MGLTYQVFSTILDEKSPEALDGHFCLQPLNNSGRGAVKLNLQSPLDFVLTLLARLPIVYKDKRENITGLYVRRGGESRTRITRAISTEAKKWMGKQKIQ